MFHQISVYTPGGGVLVDAGISLLLIVILLYITKEEIIPYQIRTALSMDKVAKYYMFFQFGRIVNSYDCAKKLFTHNATLSISILIFIADFVLFGYDLQHVNVHSFILPLCGIIIIYQTVEKYQNSLNPKNTFSWLGKHSLEIYLTHFLFIFDCIDVIDGNSPFVVQLFYNLILSLLIIVLSLGISYLFKNSDVLSFLLYGKGEIAKNLINRIQLK